MLTLHENGLVEERSRQGRREPRWFLTSAGRELLAEIGMGEPKEP
jgi:DNA-binding MarR family transcriptional regulator